MFNFYIFLNDKLSLILNLGVNVTLWEMYIAIVKTPKSDILLGI